MVGRIGRPHGVRGELSVEPRTDEPERRFAVGQQLRVDGDRRLLEVTAKRWHQGRLLLTLSGVADRTAAEGLRNKLLLADVDEREPAGDDDDFWDRDLIGLAVHTHDGVVAGEVTAVIHLDHQDLLAVHTPDGERLIPFVEALVVEVRPSDGWLRLADVAGLVEDTP